MPLVCNPKSRILLPVVSGTIHRPNPPRKLAVRSGPASISPSDRSPSLSVLPQGSSDHGGRFPLNCRSGSRHLAFPSSGSRFVDAIEEFIQHHFLGAMTLAQEAIGVHVQEARRQLGRGQVKSTRVPYKQRHEDGLFSAGFLSMCLETPLLPAKSGADDFAQDSAKKCAAVPHEKVTLQQTGEFARIDWLLYFRGITPWAGRPEYQGAGGVLPPICPVWGIPSPIGDCFSMSQSQTRRNVPPVARSLPSALTAILVFNPRQANVGTMGRLVVTSHNQATSGPQPRNRWPSGWKTAASILHNWPFSPTSSPVFTFRTSTGKLPAPKRIRSR